MLQCKRVVNGKYGISFDNTCKKTFLVKRKGHYFSEAFFCDYSDVSVHLTELCLGAYNQLLKCYLRLVCCSLVSDFQFVWTAVDTVSNHESF